MRDLLILDLRQLEETATGGYSLPFDALGDVFAYCDFVLTGIDADIDCLIHCWGKDFS